MHLAVYRKKINQETVSRDCDVEIVKQIVEEGLLRLTGRFDQLFGRCIRLNSLILHHREVLYHEDQQHQKDSNRLQLPVDVKLTDLSLECGTNLDEADYHDNKHLRQIVMLLRYLIVEVLGIDKEAHDYLRNEQEEHHVEAED